MIAKTNKTRGPQQKLHIFLHAHTHARSHARTIYIAHSEWINALRVNGYQNENPEQCMQIRANEWNGEIFKSIANAKWHPSESQ